VNLGFSALISDCLRHIVSDLHSHFPCILSLPFSISGSTVRTSLSLARDLAIMIELYLPSTVALSLLGVEHVLPASLWVDFERFVQLPVEEADFCFVLKTDVHQKFGIVVKHPVVVIKIDYKIRCLGPMRLCV